MREVFVYKNLHKNLFSIRDWRTGKVIDHISSCTLVNCKAQVSIRGRNRVRKEKRKNVHAGIRGYFWRDLFRSTAFLQNHGFIQIKYNPYKDIRFVDAEERLIFSKKNGLLYSYFNQVYLDINDGVWAQCTDEDFFPF